MLLKLNERSLLNEKVQVVNADAFTWLRENKELFDAIIIDFPDPSNFSIGKLYSTAFYQLLKQALAPDGLTVIQSTSPFAAPRSYWCIAETLQAVGLKTMAYHNYVPSFGEWGYIMAMHQKPATMFAQLPGSLKFLNPFVLQQMFIFPEDMKTKLPIEANRLNNQVLVHYFEEEWEKYLAM